MHCLHGSACLYTHRQIKAVFNAFSPVNTLHGLIGYDFLTAQPLCCCYGYGLQMHQMCKTWQTHYNMDAWWTYWHWKSTWVIFPLGLKKDQLCWFNMWIVADHFTSNIMFCLTSCQPQIANKPYLKNSPNCHGGMNTRGSTSYPVWPSMIFQCSTMKRMAVRTEGIYSWCKYERFNVSSWATFPLETALNQLFHFEKDQLKQFSCLCICVHKVHRSMLPLNT